MQSRHLLRAALCTALITLLIACSKREHAAEASMDSAASAPAAAPAMQMEAAAAAAKASVGGSLREDASTDEVLATVAHALRGPLGPIRSALETLQGAGKEDPRTAEASDLIARQVDHLSRLVEDLLDHGRPAGGPITLEPGRMEFGGGAVGSSRLPPTQHRSEATTSKS